MSCFYSPLSFPKFLHNTDYTLIFSLKMKSILSVLLLNLMCCAWGNDNLDESPLTIEVQHKPASFYRRTTDGDKLRIHYIGTLLADGSQFDSSRDQGEPFEFTLGVGQVIKGWDKGLVDMGIG